MPPSSKIAVLRILDANANRALEGLRVVEDYARFALDDSFLSGEIKALRHRLAEAIATFFPDLLVARDTQHDVGTAIRTPAEYCRPDLESVVRANWKRAEQALRVLEEYGKTDSSSAGAAFEACRYQVYQLERAMALEAAHLDPLADARLYVLIDGGPSPAAFERQAEAIVAAGAHVVQLRDKQLSDRELVDRARRLRQITRGRALFIMNDRPDLAVLADADGVHVGQDELSVKDARTLVGPRKLVGVSTHTLEQARQAVLAGASYIGCGPTFLSGTKSFERLAGVDFLRAVAAEIRLPAFAIGGITLDNLSDVQAAGFSRVAVSGAIVKASDPAGEVAAWLARLNPSPPATAG